MSGNTRDAVLLPCLLGAGAQLALQQIDDGEMIAHVADRVHVAGDAARPYDTLVPEVSMPKKLRELRADLSGAGWVKVRQKGSHENWRHPLLSGDTVILSGNDGTDADTYQERDVSKAVQRAEQARRP